MDTTVIATLLDASSLLVFVFFVVQMSKWQQENEKARNERWISSFKETTERWCASIDKFSKAIDGIGKQVAYNTSMTIKHDEWSRGKLGNGKDSDVHELAKILIRENEGDEI